ncbi:MAG TPA: glutamine amidotransferase, partial [Chthoniobacterales bacterium]|nr:glutamine amidotransferase [Chthoniobacterales bacterium]
METKILLVGESWVSTSTHLKGFDFFSSTYYTTGGDFLIAALVSAGVQVTHLPSHEAAKSFPFELGKLQEYNAVILSDIGANTLLLPPEVFLEGKRVPNRLELIKEYVSQGGGLVMAGGYLSFQGIYGSARFHRTPIEEVLPVSILAIDDRIEKPEGINPTVAKKDHPITEGLDETWPYLLGFNEVQPK